MKPLRTIRMIRLFKLLGSWKPIGKILSTIGRTIIDIGPFSIIMVVFFYIASLIGMNIFFQRVRLDHHEIPSATEGGFADANFNNLFEGSLIVYVLFENDGWSTIFFQHAQATGMIYTSCIYFIIILHFAQLVIRNLFLTILLEHFESDSQENAKKNEEYEDSDLKIKKFQEKQKKLQELIESQMDPIDMENMRMERFQAKFKNKGKVVAISNDLAKKYLFGKSLFLFSAHNPVRKFCHKLIYHPWFEKLVVAVISAANVAMCFENPLLDENSSRQFILNILTYFFTAFFIVEAILKIFVQGFAFNGHFSYMRNYVNMTDFLVAVLQLIQLSLGHKGRLLLIFRILRVPRPLQMAASGEGSKIALESLVMSMKVIGEAITILFLFFLIFAIIFVNLLKGKLNKCTDALGHHDVFENVQECYNYGGFWESYMWTYDSVPNALINLFNSATRVGYSEMMYWSAKTTKLGGTVEHYHKAFIGHEVLMIIFMLTCSILILSVFIAMIVSAFNREEERISKRILLNEFQSQWVRLLTQVMNIRPIRRIDSDSRLRVWLAEVLQSRAFLNFIAIMIFLHSVVLALKQFDQEEVFARVVEDLDHAFTILFVFECFLKLAVLRSHYFHAPWSFLDLFMAALGLTNIINAFVNQNVEPMWAIVIKALRIIRVFQLSEKIEAMRTLITSMRRSGPAIMNVGSLMVLSYIFFSVLGVFLFATVRPQWPLDHDIVNYQRLDNAFLILFRATCGENWHFIEYGISRGRSLKCQCDEHFSYEKYIKEGQPNQCGNIFLATFYFVIFHLILSEAFVDLFIGVILQNYKEVLQSDHAIINQTHQLNYQRVWLKYDPKGRGFINKHDLSKFLFELKSPLGLESEDLNGNELPFSYLSSLELSLYNDLMDIQFYNLLERLARKALIDYQIVSDIEKMNKENSYDHKQIDWFFKKFEAYSAQIKALEENKLNIHIVTEVQKIKQKYQGVGMFEIVIWKEQQSLTKMAKTVKNRYDMLHGKVHDQKPDENTRKDDNNNQSSAQKSYNETSQTNIVLTQLDPSQQLSMQEQDKQLERLMDQIVKEESGEKEEYKDQRELDEDQNENTNQHKKNEINQKERKVEVKNLTNTLLQGLKVSSYSKMLLLSKSGSVLNQPKNKQQSKDIVSDTKFEMQRKRKPIGQQKEEDIDFQSAGGRKNNQKYIQRKQVEEEKKKAKGKQSKNGIIEYPKKRINNNIDQPEAVEAVIFESQESQNHMLEEEMLFENKGKASFLANDQSTQDVKPKAKAEKP